MTAEFIAILVNAIFVSLVVFGILLALGGVLFDIDGMKFVGLGITLLVVVVYAVAKVLALWFEVFTYQPT